MNLHQTVRTWLLPSVALLGAIYAMSAFAELAGIVFGSTHQERLLFLETAYSSKFVTILILLMALAVTLLAIVGQSMRATAQSPSPFGSWHIGSVVMWSSAIAWWLLVNHPIPPAAHHLDKYLVGIIVLMLWGWSFLFAPQFLDAFLRSRWFNVVSLALINILVFVFVAEITFRVVDPWLARFISGASIATPSFLIPHAKVAGSIHQSNSLGFRDKEWSQYKAPAARRIVALGDSFTYGAGVSYDETFVTLLNSAVPQDIASVEIFNMGVPSWGPHEELALLKSTVLDFHPDLILLNIYAGNDIAEDALLKPALIVGGQRHQGIHATGNWFHDRFGPQRWFLFYHVKYLITVGPHRLREVFGLRGQPPTRWRRSAQWFCGLYGKTPTQYFSYHWNEARRVYEEMLGILRTQGIDLLIVIHPDPEQVYEWTARHLCGAGKEAEAYDFERPQRFIREWAAAHGIQTVDLLLAFRQLPNPEAYFLGEIDDNHYSAQGHRLAAEQILPFLVERLSHQTSK